MRRSMVPIFSPLERRTGVPSTRSLAIKLWDWRVDVSVCMVASITHRTAAGGCDSHLRQHSTGKRFAAGRRSDCSEQRRHDADPKRPEEDCPVVKPNWKRDRRLAFEFGPLAERRDQAGRRVLARKASKPGN